MNVNSLKIIAVLSKYTKGGKLELLEAMGAALLSNFRAPGFLAAPRS